jgi:hypothetical protein
MLRVAAMAVDMYLGVGIRGSPAEVEEDSPAVAADNLEPGEDSPAAAADNLAAVADNLELEEDSPAAVKDNPEPGGDSLVAGEGNSLAVEEGKQVRGVDNNLPAEACRQQACRIWDNRWLPGLKGSHNWCMMKPAGYRMHCRTADPGRC